jgi:predicted RNA-binding protein YlxR (DUF448 family)
VRITVDDLGLVVSRHGSGRGAWLCPRPECFDQAVRRRAFGRALRVEIDDQWIERLRVAFVRATPDARG